MAATAMAAMPAPPFAGQIPMSTIPTRCWGASITRHGTVEQIARVPEWHRVRYEAMTKFIEVLGAESPELFAGIPDDTGQAVSRADEPYKMIRLLKPWVLTLFPTESFAKMEEMTLEDAERILIEKALERCGGNVSQAADELGLSRSALYRRLQRYEL